jgi:hypothetical protein
MSTDQAQLEMTAPRWTMREPKDVENRFYYPKLSLKKKFKVQCPCEGCEVTWENIGRADLKPAIIDHILGKDHLNIIDNVLIPELHRDGFSKCLDELIITLKNNKTTADDKERAIKIKITDYAKCCNAYHSQLETKQQTMKSFFEKLNTDLDEEDETGVRKVDRINLGKNYLARAISEAGNNLEKYKSTRDIEKFLNKFGVLRAPVTELLDAAFEAREDRDMYTGWFKSDYELYVEEHGTPQATKVNHLALSVAKKDLTETPDVKLTNRFCQVDHVWEIQLITCAMQEVQRFKDPMLKLSLSDMVKIFNTVNDIRNLNVTTGKLNSYKASRAFMSGL